MLGFSMHCDIWMFVHLCTFISRIFCYQTFSFTYARIIYKFMQHLLSNTVITISYSYSCGVLTIKLSLWKLKCETTPMCYAHCSCPTVDRPWLIDYSLISGIQHSHSSVLEGTQYNKYIITKYLSIHNTCTYFITTVACHVIGVCVSQIHDIIRCWRDTRVYGGIHKRYHTI